MQVLVPCPCPDSPELLATPLLKQHFVPRPHYLGQIAAEALGIMELHEITHLVILDREQRVKGVVHLHDLLGREEFKFNGGHRLSPGTDNRPDNAA